MESVALNFVPLKQQEFSIVLYRQLRIDEKERNEDLNIFSLTLPVDSALSEVKQNFWLCFDPRTDFEQVTYSSSTELNLTNRYIFHQLVNRCKEELAEDSFIAP